MDEKEKVIPAEMPAGYAREETMKQVADELAEKGEKEYANMGGFDPSVFDEDPEILQHYNLQTNELEVVDAVPGYTYLWIRCIDKQGHPIFTTHAEVISRVQRYLGNRVPGFELVAGGRRNANFPEMLSCPGVLQADGTRRVGDVQLYRVLTPVYNALRKRQDMIIASRNAGIGESVVARAQRYPRYVKASETIGPPINTIRDRAQIRGGIPRDAYDQQVVKSLIRQVMGEMDQDIAMMTGAKSVTRK